MQIIGLPILESCQKRHPEVRGRLATWKDSVQRADWKKPADVQAEYGPDCILPNSRAVFNIKGNSYRIVVRINYKLQIVDIRFAGTHDAYNKIDAMNI